LGDGQYRFGVSVRDFAINSNGDVFAGRFEGGVVYRSTDNCDNWMLANTGLTFTDVVALAISWANGGIFVKTYFLDG
jgi:hypothetical protein